MSWFLASAACGAIASGAVTIALVAETEPFINEEGEEEYTLSGYLLLAATYPIKWVIRKTIKLCQSFGSVKDPPSTIIVEDNEETRWKAETRNRLNKETIVSSNDFELVI